jgi:hypothetical protein
MMEDDRNKKQTQHKVCPYLAVKSRPLALVHLPYSNWEGGDVNYQAILDN